jgi:hypothetical protein
MRVSVAVAALLQAVLGVITGLLLWGVMLGVNMHRQQPGLWTMRPQRIVACGLDYNGPPWTKSGIVLWLTCDSEDLGWRIWPPGR